MTFLVDINPEMELPKYKLTLHKLNEEPLASLKNIKNLNISPLFVGIDNLTFDVPLHIMNNDGTNSRNMIYDMIEGDHLVKLNNMSYFIITNVKEIADDNGRKYKEVHCKSREYSLIDKKLIDYKADSRVLYSSSNAIDEDGLEIGVLNYIFKYLTRSWTLDYIDPDLILREGKGIYRALSFDNSNLIQVFVELQKTFNCIFTFDSVGRKVSVYDIKNMMGQDRGLRISDTNFIKSITKDVNSEGIITRLYLRGKDGVSIQSISPTGQPYLDNFDYYKNTKYMSQGLIDALNNYDTKVGQYNPDFKPLFVRLDNANTVMEGLLNADGVELMDKGLVALNMKLNQIQTLIDVKVEELGLVQKTINSAESVDLSGLHETKRGIQTAMDAFVAERTVINGYIKIKDSEIVAQQLVIDGINSEIEDLQSNLDTSNVDNFTAEQLLELDEFIKVETFNDTNYTKYNLEELKEEGIRQLSRLSQPPIQFDVDVVDFLSIVECQHVWKKFKLGDTVTLEHKEMGFKFVVRLVGYEHDVDSYSLNLKFSNTNSYDDATLYERDLMEYIGNVGTTVDFNTDRWNDVGNMESRIAKLVDSKLEEARQNILNAVGQQHLFGDDGLWLYKENPDGTIDDKQIRAINNTIAFTESGWDTVGTAITGKGIVAENIHGKLGEFATVYANQIEVTADSNPEVDYNIIDYITEQTDEFDIAMGELDDVFSNAFSDNSITNIEANSLKIAFDNVKKEAMDIIAIANTLGLTTVVEKTNCYQALTNLQSEMNQWINQASYPISVTKTDRDNVSSKFTNLKSTMVLLLDRIEAKRTDDLDGKLERTKAEFKVTTDGITSRVESIDDQTISVLHDVEQLETRVNTAEQKITPDAITNTVISSNKLATKSELDDEKIYKQSSAPPHKYGRLWIDISKTPEVMYRSSGSTWWRTSATSASDLGIDLSSYAESSEVTQTASDIRYEFKYLQNTNGFSRPIEAGITTINRNGIRVEHNNGDYSTINPHGFYRSGSFGSKGYHFERYLEIVSDYQRFTYYDPVKGEDFNKEKFEQDMGSEFGAWVRLPEPFIGKDFTVSFESYLSITNLMDEIGYVSRIDGEPRGGVFQLIDVFGNAWDGQDTNAMPEAIRETGWFYVEAWSVVDGYTNYSNRYRMHVVKYPVKIDAVV